jgi:DNA-binding transcriptional LysR family regulator
MELMQLEMFVAVVEESSVRRAAKRVFRTQPAVSIALGKLQEEIGALLFEDTRRTNRKLTEAGEILYEYASRMIGMRNEALSLLRGEDLRCVGEVSIGADNKENLRLISHLRVAFNRQRPSVHVVTHLGRREQLILKLRDRKLDFALLSAEQVDKEMGADLVVTPICGVHGENLLQVIQRRVYQSDAVKAFSATLSAFSMSTVGPQ